jgi:hypothetical protein
MSLSLISSKTIMVRVRTRRVVHSAGGDLFRSSNPVCAPSHCMSFSKREGQEVSGQLAEEDGIHHTVPFTC